MTFNFEQEEMKKGKIKFSFHLFKAVPTKL